MEVPMSALTLTSPRQRSLKPLVEGAIRNEVRYLQSGIRRTEQRLRALEERYGFSSQEFLQRYEADELPETLEFAEWVGECRLLERLKEKAETLEEIGFAH
jgi:hypothetical protein